ncbi:MAG: type II secretion system minor pseudopilin GspJ [Gammaproteobacteria bacterium]
MGFAGSKDCYLRSVGFTFIEMLVAILVFSVFSYGTFIAVKVASDQRVMTDESMSRVSEIQHAMVTMSRDFFQLSPRPVRGKLGDTHIPALRSDARTEYVVELTRGGWSNHLGLPRGTLQRVAYRLEDNVLYRAHFGVLDATLANEPVETELLTGIDNIEIRFLDTSNQWSTQWPPLRALDVSGPAELRMRPVAIEIFVELDDVGEITRLIEISG